MPKTYPISLVLAGKSVLVVGGGEVAARKVKGLLDCEARVTIVSPRLTSELEELCLQGECFWLQRAYDKPDLKGAELVFVCTNDEAVNTRISAEAAEQRLPVNVADQPDLCSFYLPSVVRRDNLTISVSTSGGSPLSAKLIRKDLESFACKEIEEYLTLMQSWRQKVILTLLPAKRKLFWTRVEEEHVYELMKQGNTRQAQAILEQIYNDLETDN